MRIEFEFPQVGRKRLVATAALATTASALWFTGLIYVDDLPLLPEVDLSLTTGTAGVLVPAWVGFVTLILMERRIVRDLKRTKWEPESERELRQAVMEVNR